MSVYTNESEADAVVRIRYRYTAVATVHAKPNFGGLTVKAASFRGLQQRMAERMNELRYAATDAAENGGINATEPEPYVKELIYPAVQWSISREIIRQKDSK